MAYRLAITATPELGGFGPLLLRAKPAEVFAFAAARGYQGVELHLRLAGDVEESEIRTLMAETGLAVPTIGTGMMMGMDGLSLADPKTYEAAVVRLQAHIELAASLQSAVTVGLARGQLGSGGEREARRQQLLRGLREVDAKAEQAGVLLLLEPLNRYEADYLHTLRETRELIEELGCNSLRILADTFHMNIEERNLAEAIREAGELLGHVHLVDSNRRVPGDGHIDFASILAALDEIGYQGFLSFEALPLPDSETAAANGLRAVCSLYNN